MAMQFMDGFDYLTAANFNLKWDNAAPSSIVTGVYGNGKAIQQGGTSPVKTLSANFATGMIAAHFFVTTISAGTIFSWLDAGTLQVDLRMDGTGALFFTRNGTTIGSVSSFRLVANTWYWMEAQVTINASTGVANLYINATSILAQTGLNTKNSANAFFNQLQISNTPVKTWDSFHFWDSSAGDVTAFPYGEHEIDTELPNAVGSNTAWTRGGTNTGNNYSQVNEANEDGDTTYNSSSTAGQIDSYGFANLRAPSGTVGSVAVNIIDRVDSGTPRTFAAFVKSSSATAVGPTLTPGASYVNHQSFMSIDPNTSAVFTITGRNTAEFGMEELS